jgi:hypothetical protein
MRTLINATPVVLLSIAVWSIASFEVTAQNRRDLVDIKVTSDGQKCGYEVLDADGTPIPGQQDLFLVRAGAFLRVSAAETYARVRIEDDYSSGVKGYAHRGSAKLYPVPRLRQIIRVRGPLSKEGRSRHKVKIECCETITNDGVCVNPVESDNVASRDQGGTGEIKLATSSADAEELARLADGASSPTGHPVGPGGPDMDIEP